MAWNSNFISNKDYHTNSFVTDPRTGWKETYKAILMPSQEKIGENEQAINRVIRFSKMKAAIITGVAIPLGLAVTALAITFAVISLIFIFSSGIAAGVLTGITALLLFAPGLKALTLSTKGIVTLCMADKNY